MCTHIARASKSLPRAFKGLLFFHCSSCLASLIMRFLRNKHARRALDFYRRVFGIEPPFRVLLDGSFLAAAAKRGEPPAVALARVLQDDRIYLHVTECALAELRALAGAPGTPAAAAAEKALAAAAAAPILRCRSGARQAAATGSAHAANMDAGACLRALVGSRNAGRWVVATQDSALRNELRTVPGVPLLLYSQAVLVLDPPAPSSRARAEAEESAKGRASKEERIAAAVAEGRLPPSALRLAAAGGAGATAASSAAGDTAGAAPGKLPVAAAKPIAAGTGAAPAAAAKRRRPHGPSGPNPLSVKRKQAKPQLQNAPAPTAGEKSRRRRRQGGDRSGGGGDSDVSGGGNASEAARGSKRPRLAEA